MELQISQTADFLFRYKQLVQLFEKAQSEIEYVDVLCISSGNQILPSLLFAPNGTLKSVAALKALAYQQLSLLIKQNENNPSIAFLLLANIEQNKKTLRTWSSLPSAAPSDVPDSYWFLQRFKTHAVSCDSVRAALLLARVNDLRFYLTEKRAPRDDLDRLLLQVRERYR